MPAKRRVVIGFLGTSLDAPRGPERWERWRPTVSLCQCEDLLIDRLEVLVDPKGEDVANTVIADIRSVSPETKVQKHAFPLRDPWDFEEVYGALHDFARSYPIDTDNEEYLLHITTGTHVAQICLFLLAESRHLPGKLLQTAPPARLRKDSDAGQYRIIDLDLSRYDRIAQRFHREQRAGISFLKSGIDTRSKAFNKTIERIEHVAIHSKAPVLLMGPTGAGKSQLARRIYELKKSRRQITGPFVEVNCATLQGDGAMSALFGHKRGAFTGALHDRPGLLRSADGGVLFLDEVGELGLDEQAMLLRALEDKRFLPVGSDREAASDFQLICGTNRDLAGRVTAGRFRDDLLARINLWTFKLPGLSDRREDIEPNIRYELEQASTRTGRNVTFSKEALDKFLAFATSRDAAWRANFRDLNAAMTRMATFSPGGRITVEAVNDEIERLRAAWGGDESGDGDILLAMLGAERLRAIDLFDRIQLEQVLRVCVRSASLSDAGRQLFDASRRRRASVNDADRLRKYLARFGIAWADVRSASGVARRDA